MCGTVVEVRQEGGEGGGVLSFGHWGVEPAIASDPHCNVDLCVVGDLVRHAQIRVGQQAESTGEDVSKEKGREVEYLHARLEGSETGCIYTVFR